MFKSITLLGIMHGINVLLNPEILGGYSSEGLIQYTDSTNLTRCAVECVFDPACKMMAHDASGQRCFTYGTKLTSDTSLVTTFMSDFYIVTRCPRYDYTYNATLDVCVKVSSVGKTYADARQICTDENANIFSVNTETRLIFAADNLVCLEINVLLNPDIEGGYTSTGLIRLMEPTNLTRCAVECVFDPLCKMLAHDAASLRCYTYETEITPNTSLVTTFMSDFYVRDGDIWAGGFRNPDDNTTWLWDNGDVVTANNGGAFWLPGKPINAIECDCILVKYSCYYDVYRFRNVEST